MNVYFAQIGRDGPIKIGQSDAPARRLRELQTNVPWALHLLLVIPHGNAHEFYHHFSAARMKGEWFYPTRELLAFIDSQHKLRRMGPESWKAARRRAGTHLVYMRRVVDLCAEWPLAAADSIEWAA